MGESLSRKERRKLAEQWTTYGAMKKTAAVLGTTVTAVSVLPLFPTVTVHAEDADSQVVAPVDATEQSTDYTIDEPIVAEEGATSETETAVSEETPEVEVADAGEYDNTYSESSSESSAADSEETKAETVAPFAATTFSRSFSVNPATFIAEIASYAKPVADANDLYASVMIAQAALESGWGQSGLGSAPNYNLFGIKGTYNGQSVTMATQEYVNSQWIWVNAAFRKYPSYTESFQDNAYVLRNTSFQSGVYFYSGAWKSNTTSYRDATAWLTGRYATAPTYASSLNAIIEQYNLTQYDTPASGNSNTNTSLPGASGPSTSTGSGSSSSGTTSNSSSASTYTVRSGDSLWLIATNYGMSVNDLKSWNNLTSDTIFVGQTLKLQKSSTGSTTNNSSSTTNSASSTSSNNSTSSSATTHTVKSGEYLSLIATKYGVTVANLKSWNNLTSDLIFPNQKLKVKSSTTSTTHNSSTSKPSTNTNSSSSNTTYTVKSGDSVWLISNNYGISMDDLRSWNNISNNFIYPGQKLIVKKGSKTSTNNSTNSQSSQNNATSSSTSSTSSSGTTYTVKSGDSIWLIANNYGISMDNLRSWNNISGDFIYPGQKLTVKKGSTATSKTTTSSTSTKSAGYTVKSGDSLWLISETYGVSISQLKTLNKLSSDIIYVGQNLKVS